MAITKQPLQARMIMIIMIIEHEKRFLRLFFKAREFQISNDRYFRGINNYHLISPLIRSHTAQVNCKWHPLSTFSSPRTKEVAEYTLCWLTAASSCLQKAEVERVKWLSLRKSLNGEQLKISKCRCCRCCDWSRGGGKFHLCMKSANINPLLFIYSKLSCLLKLVEWKPYKC
jgi:hypothetical protein